MWKTAAVAWFPCWCNITAGCSLHSGCCPTAGGPFFFFARWHGFFGTLGGGLAGAGGFMMRPLDRSLE
ncbi:hypothetical protein Nepgr_031734 [Nepenthes gracilis]|uniref:Secreted protein n=1 Tax=Nepenthes gracilis TaxID=150966 RepID=A0AAD3TIP6_NEPGR|nr:hypothetical protein Nepgr_031734 [Nepenthes gracilis]